MGGFLCDKIFWTPLTPLQCHDMMEIVRFVTTCCVLRRPDLEGWTSFIITFMADELGVSPHTHTHTHTHTHKAN